MKVAHCSDTHSFFPDLPKEAEAIIHSGDLHPNITRGNVNIEIEYQKNWTIKNIETFKEWLDGRALILTEGNHDFHNGVCDILNDNKIEAYNITNEWLEYKGFTFYGIPYVNYINGEWNYELHQDEMNDEFFSFDKAIVQEKGMPNVLVCHAPPYAILDSEETYYGRSPHYGNVVLSNYLSYIWKDKLPKHIMCGHCHRAHGFAELFGVKISNAATTVHLIELV